MAQERCLHCTTGTLDVDLILTLITRNRRGCRYRCGLGGPAVPVLPRRPRGQWVFGFERNDVSRPSALTPCSFGGRNMDRLGADDFRTNLWVSIGTISKGVGDSLKACERHNYCFFQDWAPGNSSEVPSSDGLGVVDERARDVSRRASTSVGSAARRLAPGPGRQSAVERRGAAGRQRPARRSGRRRETQKETAPDSAISRNRLARKTAT